ncbi:hypothetical protein GCM10011490_24200 [Pseudoclavibacter endophyticus]|uniref:Uncharacterized protein n=1 Tax=Pseudoclavibacter endophyticus TaxID=1778590 RepID=A0A6H9WLL2_9MICO|nr:DUF6093 family protein [Pseudoclavibacter endophyticus]KAB1648422.1 hypothetical protein F8O04_12110 [Pseudoclavibacter endophyticus]GGA72584.1 hypothetical protein GCM10011490_24200 [Pseudoclavibacter endophyticus]
MGRIEAESMLTDHCVITRTTDTEEFNETTGRYEHVTVTVYEGPCSLRERGQDVREVFVAGQAQDEGSFLLKLPVESSTAVRGNDVALITLSEYDPDMQGRTFRVKAHRALTHSTLRRLPVEEVTPG